MTEKDFAQCPIEDPRERRRRVDRWHISKEITIVDILTIVSALGAMVALYVNLDKRLAIIETSFSPTSAIEVRLAQERVYVANEIRQQRLEIRQDLSEIKLSLQRLMENDLMQRKGTK